MNGIFWGKHKECGIWFTRNGARNRLLWKNHDSLFIAFWNFRIRIMRPWMNSIRYGD
jgi:hypothetical protein